MTFLEKYFEIHRELNRNNQDEIMHALFCKCPDLELYGSTSTMFDGCRNECNPSNVDKLACIKCWTQEVLMED